LIYKLPSIYFKYMDEELAKLLSEYPELSKENLEEIDEHIAVIMMVKGTEEDGVTPFWSFVAIPPTQLFGFKKAQARGEAFFVDDYGEILITGQGKEPPPEAIEEIRAKYGFDPDFEKKAMQQFTDFKKTKDDEKQTGFLMAKIKEMKEKKDKKE